MARSEIKEEINKVLDNASDEVLVDILDYLKQLLVTAAPDAKLSTNLNRILQEDKEVLERLSQ
jgi:hypothetical protein